MWKSWHSLYRACVSCHCVWQSNTQDTCWTWEGQTFLSFILIPFYKYVCVCLSILICGVGWGFYMFHVKYPCPGVRWISLEPIIMTVIYSLTFLWLRLQNKRLPQWWGPITLFLISIEQKYLNWEPHIILIQPIFNGI